MKTKYLEQLRALLEEFEANKTEIDDIISDYDQLYDDASSTGKTDEEIYQLLGNPKDVAYDLMDTLKLKRYKSKKNKIVALMPFLCTITFMILGMVYDLWHPGWMVFLLIPVTAILINTNFKNAVVALSPFLSVGIFMVLGFVYDLWHPGWLVFLSIPVLSILLHTKLRDVFVAISPFFAVTVFIILGTFYDLWNPGWLIFLIIPMIGILYKKNKLLVLIYELTFILAIGFYLYMGYEQGSWGLGALGFILPFAVGIIIGDVTFTWDVYGGGYQKKAIVMVSTVILCIALFFVLGFFLNGWVWAWQVFLLIPVTAILAFDKFRFVAISPFIAVILFFSIGYFFDMFHISWLAFMLIPIAGILENA